MKTSLTRISDEHFIKLTRTRIDDVSQKNTNKDFAEENCEKPPQIEIISEPTKTKEVN